MLASKDFFIVNECERPFPDLVAIKTEKGLCYLDRSKKSYDGMNPRRPTSLEEFGFVVQENKIENGVVFEFVKLNDSSATYKNGKDRKWQGATIFSIFADWELYYAAKGAEK